jgi:hypothetical protein
VTRALVVFAIGVGLLVSPARAVWSSSQSAPVAFVVWALVIAVGAWAVRPAGSDRQ